TGNLALIGLMRAPRRHAPGVMPLAAYQTSHRRVEKVDASCSAVEQMGDRVGNSAARERMRECAPRRLAANQRSQRASKSPSIGGKSTNTGTIIRRRKNGGTGPRPREVARYGFEF